MPKHTPEMGRVAFSGRTAKEHIRWSGAAYGGKKSSAGKRRQNMIFLRLAELLFWKPRRMRKMRYFRREYGRLPPGIYYDKRYQVYAAPAVIEEFGSIEWVCQALTSTNLCFHFNANGQDDHAHTFDAVLLCAYNHAEGFSIPKEWEQEYSTQELVWIASVVERGKRDRVQKK